MSPAGVARSEASFRGLDMEDKTSFVLHGYVSGRVYYVVKLNKERIDHERLILERLRERIYRLEHAENMIRARPMWYGTVDGELRWMAALELKEEKCENFVYLM